MTEVQKSKIQNILSISYVCMNPICKDVPRTKTTIDSICRPIIRAGKVCWSCHSSKWLHRFDEKRGTLRKSKITDRDLKENTPSSVRVYNYGYEDY